MDPFFPLITVNCFTNCCYVKAFLREFDVRQIFSLILSKMYKSRQYCI
jgi:hypothetical protein